MNLNDLRDRLEWTRPETYRASSISASVIGRDCDAAIAFNLRGFLRHIRTARSRRILDLGQVLEGEIVGLLEAAGLTITTEAPTPRGQPLAMAYHDFVKAYADGLTALDGKPCLLEIKSSNKDRWEDLNEVGLQSHSTTYWLQCHLMMWLFKIDRCLFVSYCKDNSAIYTELVEADPFMAGWARQRIEDILYGHPARCAIKAEDWRCKMCDFRHYCWEEAEDDGACVRCQHSFPSPLRHGWDCHKNCGPATGLCNRYEQWQPLPSPFTPSS